MGKIRAQNERAHSGWVGFSIFLQQSIEMTPVVVTWMMTPSRASPPVRITAETPQDVAKDETAERVADEVPLFVSWSPHIFLGKMWMGMMVG